MLELVSYRDVRNHNESVRWRKKMSDAARRALELDQKFAEHIRKLSQTEAVSYIDEDGYLVMRSSDGVITRLRDVPSVKS